MKNAFLLLALAVLASCGGSNKSSADAANTLTSNDFDSLDGWVPENPTLTKEQAHSGRYSIKVDAGHEFSLGYSNLLGRMSQRKLRKIHLTAWAYLPSSKATARLGMQILDPNTGQEVFGDGINLTDQVKNYRKWVEVEKDIELPANILPSQQLRLFLWRSSSSESAYIDDLTLSAAE